MTFENNLYEFNFNLETLDLLVEEGVKTSELLSTLKEAGFSQELSKFLLDNSRSYVNSLLVRLKLYHKLNKSNKDVREALSKYQVSALVDKLFPSVNTTNEADTATVVDKSNELLTNESDNDEDTLMDVFYNTKISKSNNTTDKVKISQFYDAFTELYNDNSNDDEVPTKKELKVFLTGKLGKSTKGTWSKVLLIE